MMNKDMSIGDLILLIASYARRARLYNKLVWQARKRGDSVCSWMLCRADAMKKARHFAKVVKQLQG